jgi:hypothetical protein
LALAVAASLSSCAMPGRKTAGAVVAPAASRLTAGGVRLHVDEVVADMPSSLPTLAVGHAVAVVWPAPSSVALAPSTSTTHGFVSVDVVQPLALAWLLHGRVVRTAVVGRCRVSCPAYNGPTSSEALVIASGASLPLHSLAVFS